MDWFISLVKMAGASFPGAASFVQLLSDLESNDTRERLGKFEDPISNLHPDIHELSKLIYLAIKESDKSDIELPDELYERYSRALSNLESEGLIKGIHTLTKRYYGGFIITDPSFIIYMCVQYEDNKKMEKLYKQIDGCSVGSSLDGKEIEKETGLPLPVINAAFQIFEAKGYGICSKESGSVFYICNA